MNTHSSIDELLQELSDLREENASLQHQMRTDQLTELCNMRALDEHVAASPYDGYFIFGDMDGLGVKNKTLGHDYVDSYIIEFGNWLRENTRLVRDGKRCDAIAIRRSGDEFIVWTSNRPGAVAIRNRIRDWVSKDGNVTCSAGMGRDRQAADENCSQFKNERKKAA